METVAVILSSYNGEKYISEQIESIINQKNVDIKLFIRDDGSKDCTKNIIEEFIQNYDNITLLKNHYGDNIGVRNSFLYSLQEVLNDYPSIQYFSFADQDDIWMENKIIEAIKKLQCLKEEYLLYYSNKLFFNNTTGEEKKENISFYDDFFESYCSSLASGCTMIINRNMAELSVEKMPQNAKYHDVWIYRLAKYIGAKIVFDPNSYIHYRIHNNNVCGVAECIPYEQSMGASIKLIGKKTSWRQDVFDEMEEYHSKLICSEAKKYIEMFKGYKKSIKLFFKLFFEKSVKKRGFKFALMWKFKVLFHLV